MPEVRLEPDCFDAETGEELGDGKVSDRMIVIEWSAEALSVVYCFANRVLDRWYYTEQFPVYECPTWDNWLGWGLPPYEYVLENYALEHAKQNYAA